MPKLARKHKVLADFRGAKDGKFHTVHFRQFNPKTQRLESQGYEVYFDNKPFLKPSRGFDRFSRREARVIAKLYNGEARWPNA